MELEKIFKEVTYTKRLETDSFVDINATCKGIILKDCLPLLGEWRDSSPIGDGARLTITANEGPFSVHSSDADYTDFKNEWEKLAKVADINQEIEINWAITKSVSEHNSIFIYDFNNFCSYLQSLTIVEVIEVYSDLLHKCGDRVIFICPSLRNAIHSAGFYFLQSADNFEFVHEAIDHVAISQRLKSICHFSGINQCIALPEDFDFNTIQHFPKGLQTLLQQAQMLLILSVLNDYTTIEGDNLLVKLNGYKTFNNIYSLSQLSIMSLDKYFELYNWIIKDGNLLDKIGLARNILSLYMSSPDTLILNEDVVYSVQSGFKIYQKQNIKQYIELRNKMSDQLIGFNEKAGKIVDTFAGNFQKSALAVVSLYASMIISRIFSSQDFMSLFNLDVTILATVFLSIACVYFLFSRWEVKQQTKRFEAAYQNMKKRNEDLLTPDDIERILNKNYEFNEDLKFIKGKECLYTTLWSVLLAFFFLATIILFIIHNIHIFPAS